MSLVIGEDKVEDWDAGKVGSHRECQVSVQSFNRERVGGREDSSAEELSCYSVSNTPLSQPVPSVHGVETSIGSFQCSVLRGRHNEQS